MFENVASKIQKAAKIIWIVGLIVSAMGHFVGMLLLISTWAKLLFNVAEVVLMVFGVMIGCLISFAVSALILYFITLCIYGFGQIIENTDTLVENQKSEEEEQFVAFNK